VTSDGTPSIKKALRHAHRNPDGNALKPPKAGFYRNKIVSVKPLFTLLQDGPGKTSAEVVPGPFFYACFLLHQKENNWRALLQTVRGLPCPMKEKAFIYRKIMDT